MKSHFTVVGFLVCLLAAAAAHSDVFFTEAEVQQALFPGVELLEHPVTIDKSLLKTIKKATSARLITNALRVWQVRDNHQLKGWLFIAEVLGKHENIRYALALDSIGNITAMEIMEYKETHGGQVADLAWRLQLYGKSLSDRFKLGDDIDNISGATLSCRHLADGIHGLLIVHDRLLRNPQSV